MREEEFRDNREKEKIGEVKGFLKMNERKKDERNIPRDNYQSQTRSTASRKSNSGIKKRQE